MKMFDNFSLRTKLYFGLGLMRLIVVLGVTFTMMRIRSNLTASKRMTNQVVPIVAASMEIQIGFNRSIAALRGWMLLGRPEFKKERQEAIEKQIRAVLARIQFHHRSGNLNSPDRDVNDNVRQIEELLDSLLAYQNQIEGIAQTPENIPPIKMWINDASPTSFLSNSLAHLIDMERRKEANASRKELLIILAHTHGITSSASANLRDYLLISTGFSGTHP